jgi:hypothetical protein
MAARAECLKRKQPVAAERSVSSRGVLTLVREPSAPTDGGVDLEAVALNVAAPVGDDRRVVAVILEDGSVRATNGQTAAGNWSSGSLSGQDWILWWNRRAFRSSL